MPENYWTLQPEQIEHIIWSHWPLERLIYVFLAVAFLAIWVQVTLLHWRGGFRSPFMWGP